MKTYKISQTAKNGVNPMLLIQQLAALPGWDPTTCGFSVCDAIVVTVPDAFPVTSIDPVIAAHDCTQLCKSSLSFNADVDLCKAYAAINVATPLQTQAALAALMRVVEWALVHRTK